MNIYLTNNKYYIESDDSDIDEEGTITEKIDEIQIQSNSSSLEDENNKESILDEKEECSSSNEEENEIKKQRNLKFERIVA